MFAQNVKYIFKIFQEKKKNGKKNKENNYGKIITLNIA